MTGRYKIPRGVPTAVGLSLVVVVTLVFCAVAFTVTGGTGAQRALVQHTIAKCSLPAAITDAELRSVGPVKIILCPMDGVSGYSEWGRMYVNSTLTGQKFTEIVAHEWCHQIWYTLGPKWWAKWADICNGQRSTIWTQDYYENFAECAKLAYFPGDLFYRPYPVTELKVTSAADVKDWVTVARYVNKCPFSDLQPTVMQTSASEDELAAAAGYTYDQGLISGFADARFHPYDLVTKRQLALICGRAGSSAPSAWLSDASPATRAEVRSMLDLSWTEQRWDENITRGQLARLLWRAR